MGSRPAFQTPLDSSDANAAVGWWARLSALIGTLIRNGMHSGVQQQQIKDATSRLSELASYKPAEPGQRRETWPPMGNSLTPQRILPWFPATATVTNDAPEVDATPSVTQALAKLNATGPTLGGFGDPGTPLALNFGSPGVGDPGTPLAPNFGSQGAKPASLSPIKTASQTDFAPKVVGDTERWEALRQISRNVGQNASLGSEADGVAAAHSHRAREEAALKLIGNHQQVLQDVTNPTKRDVTNTKPLTQLELQRVEPWKHSYVDQALREVARRLLGRRPGLHQLEVRVSLMNSSQIEAWAQTAVYLDGRIQANHEEKPGRTPDMSPEAAAAMRAVLKEVGGMGVTATLAASAPMWAMLHERASLNALEADGAAAAHSHTARLTAAMKLIMNHELVLRDATNPTNRDVTDTVQLTQDELQRVPPQHALYVDQALREVARRLIGRVSDTADNLVVKVNPKDATYPAQAAAWAKTAVYLDGRIQSTDAEKPGRTPDLPPDAAEAMRAVLKEVGSMGASTSVDSPPAPMLSSGGYRLRRSSFSMRLPGFGR